jgi:hypothetical protein
MAIALILDSNGNLAQITDGAALQADKFERKSASTNLLVGSALGAEELRLGSSSSLIHSLGDLQVDGYVQVLDTSAPGNPSSAEGRLYKLSGYPGIWWINDSWGAAIDLTAFRKDDISGFGISRNATNPLFQVDIAAGWCRSDDDTWNIKSTSTITVSMTASGLNGLDAGVEAANTWYYIFVVYNPATRAIGGLVSTSATSPTMPSGYTKKRRVGVVRNNASSNFVAWTQFRKLGRERVYLYDVEDADNLQVLNGGTSTSYTDINCRSFIPPTSDLGIFYYAFSSTSPYNHGKLRTNGLSQNPPIAVAFGGTTALLSYAAGGAQLECRTDSSGIVEYANDSSGGLSYLWVDGFVDFV